MLAWARTDPAGLRAAARAIATGAGDREDAAVRRLLAILRRFDLPKKRGGLFGERLLNARPEALVEAVEILIRRGDAVRAVLTHPGYLDPRSMGGELDRDLPAGARGTSTAQIAK
jgi:hypothetical protein